MISGAALSIVICVVILNVLARYIFSVSFNWAEEVATIGYCWVVFVGASACYKRHLHIGIDIVTSNLPPRISNALAVFTSLLLILTNMYLTYLSVVLSLSAWVKPTAVLRIPYTCVDMSATLGFALMTFYSIRHLAAHFRKSNGATPSIREHLAPNA